MKKIIFVIGSNSFAGANFVNFLLSKKYKVFGSSRSVENNKVFLKYKNNKYVNNFKFYKIDINKDYKKFFKILDKIKPNIIINFTAQGMVDQSWDNPFDWYKTNILSNVRLTDHLKNKKYLNKFINFSTPEVYGNYMNKINSNTKFDPSTPYALSRMTFDIHLNLINKVNKFPFITTRASNIYGPHQQIYRLIPKIIFCCLSNRTFELDGTGDTKRSFIFMDDVSNALYKILLKGKIGETYNISTNEIYSIKKILKLVQNRMTNKKLEIKIKKDRRFKDLIYNLDSKKIRKEFNWNEKYSLVEGIDKTIEWITNNLNYINKQNKNYVHKK